MRVYPSLRRALALSVCAVALTVAWSAPASAAGFKFGVASADVTSSSALLWTRSDTSGTLKLHKTYYYRFTKGKTKTSVTGKFRTAPKASALKTIRFAVSGDADAERA